MNSVICFKVLILLHLLLNYVRASYGKPVDIWAIGCILGELSDGQVSRKTGFKINDL